MHEHSIGMGMGLIYMHWVFKDYFVLPICLHWVSDEGFYTIV